jgi:hypothetical protein
MAALMTACALFDDADEHNCQNTKKGNQCIRVLAHWDTGYLDPRFDVEEIEIAYQAAAKTTSCGDSFHVYTPDYPEGDSHIDLQVQVSGPKNPRGCLGDGKSMVFSTTPDKKTLRKGEKICAEFAGDPTPAVCLTMQ